VVGGGYRGTADDFVRGPGTVFLDPAERTLRLANGFIQDQIALNETLSLTLGLKAEHNTYTGLEFMPDARLAWRVFGNDLVWGAISRAVRRPARFDRDLFNPGVFAGGPDFDSENLIAYELGYRGQPTAASSFSISAFYNVYDDLRTVEASTPAVFPLVVRNSMEGETFGIALWGNYALTDWWRVSAGFNTLHKDLRLEPGSRDIFGVQFAGNDPAYQASLRSTMDLPHNVQFDAILRAIDDLPSPRVPGYVEADVRIGWRATEALELSVTGANLLHSRHTEFINPSVTAQEIPRSVTAGARWRF
jgi:iron complex outermembrane receptor protein